jgi:hypothetical protein
MQKEWKVARTVAHLWVNGNFSGLSFPLRYLTPEILKELNLPGLPK